MSLFLDTLNAGGLVVAAELRPPRAELASADGMDAWIDTYHAVRTLSSRQTFVFLTDSAVGVPEEDNLRHLIVNLGDDAPLDRVVPFLTSKHPLDYCLAYADRANQHGFESLVVLGGDKRVGVPRSVEHAWQLRRQIRERTAGLALGGWANPYRDAAQQVAYLVAPEFTGEFFLTQVVSHHEPAPVERFLNRGRPARREGPGGVRRVLLPQRAAADAVGPAGVHAGAGGGAREGVRRRRVAGGGLRAHDSSHDGARRSAVLREQPPAAAHARDAGQDHGTSSRQ